MGKDEKQTEADGTRCPRAGRGRACGADLAGSPAPQAEEIRGSKRFWRVISTINPGNSVAYWLVGRKYGRSRPA